MFWQSNPQCSHRAVGANLNAKIWIILVEFSGIPISLKFFIN